MPGMFNNPLARIPKNVVLLPVLVLAIVIGISMNRPVLTQTTDATELAGIRRTLEEIVTLMRETAQQSVRRDNVAMLSQRLEASERRLTSLERDLKLAQDELAAAEGQVAATLGAIQSMNEMAKLDKTGAASEQINNQLNRLQGESDRQANRVGPIAQRVAMLDADVAQRRQAVAQLERALDQQMGIIK
jgi:chromosome segregation ATPase